MKDVKKYCCGDMWLKTSIAKKKKKIKLINFRQGLNNFEDFKNDEECRRLNLNMYLSN